MPQLLNSMQYMHTDWMNIIYFISQSFYLKVFDQEKKHKENICCVKTLFVHVPIVYWIFPLNLKLNLFLGQLKRSFLVLTAF